MSFEVYDYRTDIRNVLVTPEIRARLYQMKPGQVDQRHSHDLGHEIFLILEGRAEFEIDGEIRALGPGQMCIALADQIHQVRNLLHDRPTTMYLSVTPHIQPTHTLRRADGSKEPPRFRPSTDYDVAPDAGTPTEALVDRHLAAVEALAQTVEATTKTQREQAAAFKAALASGDKAAALDARDAMWAGLYEMYTGITEVVKGWNTFTARTAEEGFGKQGVGKQEFGER